MAAEPIPQVVYDSPHQFEPLLPRADLTGDLRERADEVARASLKLTGRLPATTLRSLRELVRAMNSYYSNRIEGQGTHPRNIDALPLLFLGLYPEAAVPEVEG